MFRNLFEHEEDYNKPVGTSIYCSNNFINSESNSDKNKSVSV